MCVSPGVTRGSVPAMMRWRGRCFVSVAGACPRAGPGERLATETCQLTAGHWIGAVRAIRTGQLHGLPHFHTRPVNVMVFHGPVGRSRLEVGFPLRCFQRLSRPYLATRPCHWRDNRCTRGMSIPVLSY